MKSNKRIQPTTLFLNTRFLSLLGGQGISYFGNSISSIALPILILNITSSGFIMGLIGTLEIIPLFLVGLPAGVWVDRWNRKIILLVADFSRFVLIGLIPIAAMFHIALLPVIAIVMLATGIFSVFFDAAYAALIPSTVPSEQLGRANGYIEAIESIAFALGPSLGGVLTTKIGPAATLGLDSLSFLVSALMISNLRTVQSEQSVKPDLSQNFFMEMRIGLRVLLGDPAMRGVTLLWGCNRFTFTALIPALTFFILKSLHGNSTQVGIAVSVYALGSLLGTLLATKTPQDSEPFVAIIGQGFMIFSSIMMSLSNGPGLMLISSTLLGLGEGILLVCYLTIRSRRVPEQVLGRVSSSASMLTQGMGTFGLLVVGACLSSLGGHITWMVLAALSMVGTIPLIKVRKG